MISAALDFRAKFLTRWIKETFPGAYSHLLNHNLLDGLSKRGMTANYVSSSNFSTAILELMARYWTRVPANLNDIKSAFNDFEKGDPKKFSGALQMFPEDLRRSILVYISEAQAFSKDEGQQLAHFRSSLENWFDSMMERITGNYKRKAMKYTFIVALLVTFGLNVDSVEIVSNLASDREALAKVTEAAEREVATLKHKPEVDKLRTVPSVPTSITHSDTTGTANANSQAEPGPTYEQWRDTLVARQKEVEKYKEELGSVIKLGWKKDELASYFGCCDSCSCSKEQNDKEHDKTGVSENKPCVVTAESQQTYTNCIAAKKPLSAIFSKIIGLLITAFAVSLGAPFWYDLLLKVADIRSSIKPATASEKEKEKTK